MIHRFAVVLALALLGGCSEAPTPAAPAPQPSGVTQTASISIEGMHCQGCVDGITGTVKKLPGVAEVKVDLEGKSASVTYDPAMLKPEAVVDAVNKLGYKSKVTP